MGRITNAVRLSLPNDFWKLLKGMAQEREISLNKLLAELIMVGFIGLQYESTKVETERRVGDPNADYS